VTAQEEQEEDAQLLHGHAACGTHAHCGSLQLYAYAVTAAKSACNLAHNSCDSLRLRLCLHYPPRPPLKAVACTTSMCATLTLAPARMCPSKMEPGPTWATLVHDLGQPTHAFLGQSGPCIFLHLHLRHCQGHTQM